MKVIIEVLRQGAKVGKLLREHGWTLDPQGGPHYAATHPRVTDQEKARISLNVLGLLTSPAVRINFDPRAG